MTRCAFVAVGKNGAPGLARKLRATAVFGCLGLAALAAAVLSEGTELVASLEGRVPASPHPSSNYWGAGAPAWWSDYPVVASGAAGLAVPAAGVHVLVKNKVISIPVTLSSSARVKAAAEQRLRAKSTRSPAEQRKDREAPVERGKVAEEWLNEKGPSNAGHWVWLPWTSPAQQHHSQQQLVQQQQLRRHAPTAAWRENMKYIPYRVGSYTTHPPPTDAYGPSREGMPFRNGKFTHQHWWDEDGQRRIWDTDTFSSSADASVARNGRFFGYGKKYPFLCSR